MTSYACFGAFEIAYTRTGRGDPVLLLAERELHDAIHGALVERFSVVAPLDAARSVSLGTDVLRQFLEALGLSRLLVVAQGPLAAPALGLCRADQGFFPAVLVLCGARCDCAPPGESDADTLRMHVNLVKGVPSGAALLSLFDFLERALA